MNTEKTGIKIINIGTASLLVVFFALCMITFALLSLSTAKGDYSFSEKLADKTTAYYRANSEAERTLAAVHKLIQHQDNGFSQELFTPYGITLNEDTLSWQVPINDDQILAVELVLTADEEFSDHGQTNITASTDYAAIGYRIIRWQVVTTREWVSDQTLNVITIPDESED